MTQKSTIGPGARTKRCSNDDLKSIVCGDSARKLYEWFEAVQKRAAAAGISLPPLNPSELREFS